MNQLRYLQDTNQPNGSVYSDLSFSTYQGVPAWTLRRLFQRHLSTTPAGGTSRGCRPV